jgi:hypothetical protein
MDSPAKAAALAHFRALRAIMHERDCSLDEANEIYWERWAAEKQKAFQSFTDELNTKVETIERAERTMPHYQRELMMSLPWRQGIGMAVRYLAPRQLAPRQRGRCERRPRVRAVRRRRSSQSTRAGPEEGDPEPAGRGDPVGGTSRDFTRALEAALG